MWKAEAFFENAWRPLSGLVEITGRAPSTSVVREIARSSFPNAPNFLRHLDNEMEATPAEFMADGRRDAIELWATSAEEQSRRFDWALPHKIVSIGDALALYSLDAIEQQPLTVAWHDRTAVIIPLTGEEQQVTIEYQPNLQDDARVNQMRHRHASQSHQLETIFDWRGYFGRESVIIDGWTTMYRRGKKWVVTLRGKAGYLVGYVLQRITKAAPIPTLTSDPLAQCRLIQMEERYPHIAATCPDFSAIDAVNVQQAVVFVHGTASCGIQSLKELYLPTAFPFPIFRFEHDTFQPIKQNSDMLVQLIEEKLFCQKLMLVAHS